MSHTWNKILVIVILSLVGIYGFFFFRNPQINEPDNMELLVGTNAEYPPFSYLNEEGIITGFDIDLIQALAREIGKKVAITDMPFDALIPSIQSGTLHVIAAGLTPSETRSQTVSFTPCYFYGDPLIIVSLEKNNLKTVPGLFNKIVAVNEGYTADYYITTFPEITVVKLPSVTEALLAVENNRADAFVTARSSVKKFFDLPIAQKFVYHPIPGTEEKYAMAVSKKYPHILQELTNALETLEKNGFIDELKKRWGLV